MRKNAVSLFKRSGILFKRKYIFDLENQIFKFRLYFLVKMVIFQLALGVAMGKGGNNYAKQ